MTYVPDMSFDRLHELRKPKDDGTLGDIKHAAFTLWIYYCRRRNHKTGLCFPGLAQSALDSHIPRTNVFQLRSFLAQKFWILIEGKSIRPLMGFYHLEFEEPKEGVKVLVSRTEYDPKGGILPETRVLINRTFVLINRTKSSNKQNALYKEVLNQLNRPAQLTSEGAGLASAPPAPDENSFSMPAEKPTPAAPAQMPAPPPSAGKPAEKRIDHPAVQMVKTITKRYAKKDLWNRLIRELGDEPDVEFFTRCFEVWRGFSGKPDNFEEWIFTPNKTGKPPQRFESRNGYSNGNGNGNGRPKDVPKKVEIDESTIDLDDRDLLLPGVRETVLESLRELAKKDSASWAFDLEKNYHPEDWKWLMENLEI